VILVLTEAADANAVAADVVDVGGWVVGLLDIGRV